MCHQIEILLIEFRTKERDCATDCFDAKVSKLNVNSQRHHGLDSAIWSPLQSPRLPMASKWLSSANSQ